MPGPKILAVAAVCAAAVGFGSARLIGPRPAVPEDDPAEAVVEPLAAPSGEAPTLARPAIGPALGIAASESPARESARELLEGAVRFTDALVAAFPIDPDCLEVKARLMDWLGKTEEAAKCWEKCLELEPDYAYAYRGLGTSAAAKGEHAKAAELFRKALELDPASYAACIGLAQALVDSHREKEAAPILEAWMRRDPRSYGYFVLGQAYLQIQQLEKARDNFEAAVRKYPDYAEAHYRLSTLYQRLGQPEEAKEHLKKSRELKAQRRVEEKEQKKRYDDLGTVSTRVAETYAAAGRIYFANGKRREAEELWRRAAALAPADVESRQGLAWLCRQEGRTRETIAVLQQLAGLQPSVSSYWLEIGRLNVELVRFDAAEQAMRKALAVTPKNAECLAALAGLYLGQDRQIAEAVVLARGAVDAQPTAEYCSLLSAACQRNSDLVGAVAAIERAMKLEPANPQYRALRERLVKQQQEKK